MQNRKIRHLFTTDFTGGFYVAKDQQTDENINLINCNLTGFKAIARLSSRITNKYWIKVNKGRTIVVPAHFTK